MYRCNHVCTYHLKKWFHAANHCEHAVHDDNDDDDDDDDDGEDAREDADDDAMTTAGCAGGRSRKERGTIVTVK